MSFIDIAVQFDTSFFQGADAITFVSGTGEESASNAEFVVLDAIGVGETGGSGDLVSSDLTGDWAVGDLKKWVAGRIDYITESYGGWLRIGTAEERYYHFFAPVVE